MVVRHLDGDQQNNRPENLAYGTQAQNIADKHRHGTMRCGERSHLAKLTDAQWRGIIARRRAGETARALAAEFGVHPSTIGAVLSGRFRKGLGIAPKEPAGPEIIRGESTDDEMRAVPSWAGYFAAADGTIWSDRPSFRNPCGAGLVQLSSYVDRYGYLIVGPVPPGGKRGRPTAAHTLVAEAFIGPRPAGYETGHLNGIRSDNRPENLAYVTSKENARHRAEHGGDRSGEKNHNSRLSDAVMAVILGRLSAGERQVDLAREYGISTNVIWRARARSELKIISASRGM